MREYALRDSLAHITILSNDIVLQSFVKPQVS